MSRQVLHPNRSATAAQTAVHSVICACAVAALASSALAQGDWIKQAVFPTARDLHGAAFTSPDHGFIVGANRHLLETFDGGVTWTVRKAGDYGTDPYYAVYFYDSTHGYITGNNSDAWRTTDGGATWLPMSGVPGGSWYHIDFVAPTAGFIGANGACSFTDDGGQSWQVRSGYPTCPVMYGMDFRDASLGLVAGNQLSGGGLGIYRTNDGGVSWARVLAQTTNDVDFMTANRAIAAVVGDLRIYESTDAGQTWRPISNSFPEHGPLINICRVSNNVAVGTSEYGDVWLSTDGGSTWSQRHEPLGDLPYKWDVSFSDAQHGWVVGPYGLAAKSVDGGFTWETVTQGVGADINDIEMRNDLFGMAVAGNGYLLRTTDSGHNWDVQKLEVTGQIFNRDETLEAIDILDDQHAFVAGQGGTVFRSDDGGLNWDSIGYPDLPSAFAIHDLAFPTSLDGWLVGQDLDLGHQKSIYHTTDGGATWQRPFDSGALWQRVQFLDSQRGWLQSAGSLHRRTIDGGQTWQDFTLPGDPTVEDMVFTDAQNGWVVGWWGYYAKTGNGGQTWQSFSLANEFQVILAVDALSENEAWIAGVSSNSTTYVVKHTTNGGATWQLERTYTLVDAPYELAITASGRVWVGGFRGAINASDPVPIDGILLAVGELHRGRTATLMTTRANPGEQVHFLYSLRGIGNGPCPPQLGGLCIDLMNPVTDLGSAFADFNGTARLDRLIPSNAPLREVYFQSVIRRGNDGSQSVKSNPVTATILP